MVDSARRFGIDTNGEPSEETVSDLGSKVNILVHRVHRGRFLGHDPILRVSGEFLSVLVVRGQGLDSTDQRLVEESLESRCKLGISEGLPETLPDQHAKWFLLKGCCWPEQLRQCEP